MFVFFFSSRRRHTRCGRDWSSDVCSSDLLELSLSRSTLPHDLADGGGARDACILSDGHAGDVADHSRLYDFRLLGLCGKAARGRRISLRLARYCPSASTAGSRTCAFKPRQQRLNQSISRSSIRLSNQSSRITYPIISKTYLLGDCKTCALRSCGSFRKQDDVP